MEEEGNVTRTVLQEADSTVNIEQPQFESMEESPCKKPRDSCEATKPSLKSLLNDGTMKSEVVENERTKSGPESVESEHLEREGDRGNPDEVQPEANCRLKGMLTNCQLHEYSISSLVPELLPVLRLFQYSNLVPCPSPPSSLSISLPLAI